jgi:hypothetical protein
MNSTVNGKIGVESHTTSKGGTMPRRSGAKAPTDPVNAFILGQWAPGVRYEDLADRVNQKFPMARINAEAVRGRVRQLRKKYGDNFHTTFSSDLEANGFDNGNWSHGWLKTENSSIFIRNEKGFVTYEEMRDELVAEMKKYAPKYPKIKRVKITDGHLLIIDPADVHIGKLSLTAETGVEYNIAIAKQRCIDGVNGIVEKASGFPIEKIILVIGNDALHTDTPRRTTTAGTNQDTDGMWWQMYKEAKDMYVQIIENLMTIAELEVVFCPSNHDYMSGFMLADSLASWFHRAGITFHTDIIHRKYLQYGTNMLAFDHGDGSKENDTKDLMADEAPRMWADTKFRYAYKHHKHHKRKLVWQSGKDYIGVTVEYLRSPSPADGWHHRNGYISPKAIEGFIHSRTNGQVARLTHYF